MCPLRAEHGGLLWEQGDETLRIEPWGPDGVRVRGGLRAAAPRAVPGALLDPAPCDARVEVGAERAVLRNGAIAAEVTAAGRVRFVQEATGAELLAEEPGAASWPPARYYKAAAPDLLRVEARFTAYEDERCYGLGQHQHGRLDQKGCVLDLVQHNTEVNIPFLLSSRGYGFLWNNPAVGRLELGHNATRWVAGATGGLDYWVTAGDTPARILERYADATGHPPRLPAWAAGFWQSKLRYRTQDEVLAVAREHRRRGLPLSVIVIDALHWTTMGDWGFDPRYWPDPAGMVRELESLGVKAVVSVWPAFDARSAGFAEMRKRGLLVRAAHGVPAHLGFIDDVPVLLSIYDATDPPARELMWNGVRAGYYRHGIKSFWLDGCEPEISPFDFENLQYRLGNGLAVTNLYPLLNAQTFFDGLRAEGEDEFVLLSRSAWAGSQRYATAVWSGDVDSSFEALRAQIPAGLNIGLSGIPWWTTDIGGFHGGDPESPAFRELVVRWFQFGAFCPLFRLHGFRRPIQGPFVGDPSAVTGGPNEVWSFGDEAYEIIRGLLYLRERLQPYILAQMDLAHERGIPPMRPLFFEFPGDPDCVEVDDQFMLGPDILVAPVLDAGARQRAVYLPAGIDWADAWTGEQLRGGQRLRAEAPLDRIPVYTRVGGDVEEQRHGDRE